MADLDKPSDLARLEAHGATSPSINSHPPLAMIGLLFAVPALDSPSNG
jgi:hypothetical protein